MFGTIVVLLGIPTALGMWVAAHYWPAFAQRAAHPLPPVVAGIFRTVRARRTGRQLGLLPPVRRPRDAVRVPAERLCVAHGLLHGQGRAPAEADRRAVALEVGIQNSGFGLALVFNFFGGLGGMAIVAAWWGIWHIVVGTDARRPGGAVIRPGCRQWRSRRERPAHFRHRRGGLSRQRRCSRSWRRDSAPANSTVSSRATCARSPTASRTAGRRVRAARRARCRGLAAAAARPRHRHRRAPRRHRDARRQVES